MSREDYDARIAVGAAYLNGFQVLPPRGGRSAAQRIRELAPDASQDSPSIFRLPLRRHDEVHAALLREGCDLI